MALEFWDSSPKVLLIVSLTTVVVGSISFWWQSRKQKLYNEIPTESIEIPTKWKQIGKIKDLVIYPLKGAKRKCVPQAECTKVGMKQILKTKKLSLQDRVFVLLNEKHEFLSIKKNTKVLSVDTESIDDTRVRFSYPDAEDLIVEIPDSTNSMSFIEIYHGETVETVDCGDTAAAWFSQTLLSKPDGLRLGCFVQSLVPPRTLAGSYDKKHTKVFPKFHKDYMGTYHNLASYMLMSEESVTDLNSRIVNLRSPVNVHYFRPNIVVSGSPAYSEDNWDWIKIGEQVILRGFKNCTRCTITTVDPDTGARDPKIEPLKTLRSFRLVEEPEMKKIDGKDPKMGQYAGCHRTGLIRVDDPVYINIE